MEIEPTTKAMGAEIWASITEEEKSQESKKSLEIKNKIEVQSLIVAKKKETLTSKSFSELNTKCSWVESCYKSVSTWHVVQCSRGIPISFVKTNFSLSRLGHEISLNLPKGWLYPMIRTLRNEKKESKARKTRENSNQNKVTETETEAN